ncbi:efflux RND transporter periplasmic adaptor subunit [Micromonospora sp. RHAY321]|uniref:efflux RND transporter periplasmic adaptor subunit n=1 Tax=Micromonospora sp. RHAY321 TaxID=2944807 RepID=UPI00207CAD7A|nr:efflux RND transporter periplasmic adaptor subunit [Micromonospora sp. RHAY321]MCO1593896.1 efflux RND transporter periplasmic adaptor subunit [Micromonospora sp. RHAY321]
MPVRRLPFARRPWVLVNAVLGVAIAGGAMWAYMTFVKPDPSLAAANGGIRTVAVAQGKVTSTVSASGTVQSATTADPAFATNGTVSEVRVKVGDVVAKGAVLAKVDATAAKRQLTAAQADLDAATAALNRAEDAGSDTSDAEAQVTSAELEVEKAQEAVDGTTLKAPIAGTVVAVNGSVGSSSGASSSGGSTSGGPTSGATTSGSTGGSSSSTGGSTSSSAGFIQLADLSKLEVSAAVAETDATKLKAGQTASVSWNALAGATATAKLGSIDPNATTSNNVVTYGVIFTLDDLPDGVRAGQTVNVSVTVGEADNVIYVNPAALTTVGARQTVIAVRNGQQETRSVEIGLTGDQGVEITSGLQVGEQVVLKTSSSGTSGNGGPGGGLPGGGGFPGGGGAPAGGGVRGGGAAPAGGGR